MPTLLTQPTRIQSAGTKPKLIDEYIGRVNSQTSGVSVAHMRSPEGWTEPGQTPEFDEFTIVLRGSVRVRHAGGETGSEGRTSGDYASRRVDPVFDAGCGTARSILRFACRRFRWRRCTGLKQGWSFAMRST